MAKKATLLSTINGFLTATITQAKVRSAAAETVNELFSTPIVERYESTGTNTQLITASVVNGIKYELTFVKKGNVVHVLGYLRNSTTSSIGSTNIISFTNVSPNTDAYHAKTGHDTNVVCLFESSTGNCTLSFSGNSIYLIDSIPAGRYVNINLTYLIND
ncbi:MAG TPA: hypothetical protein PLK20_05975 [Paludibacteraceae bacterium]|nr:hypothetical protein [Paludibacteraceae bacterium]